MTDAGTVFPCTKKRVFSHRSCKQDALGSCGCGGTRCVCSSGGPEYAPWWMPPTHCPGVSMQAAHSTASSKKGWCFEGPTRCFLFFLILT